MTTEEFINLALSYPDTLASPHFDRTAFKIINKKIFCTLHSEGKTANLKLTPNDQYAFSLINREAISAINNKWGLQGWTTFNLERIELQLMKEALDAAYENATSKASPRKR